MSDETVRLWRQPFGPMFAARIRLKRGEADARLRLAAALRQGFVRIDGAQHRLKSRRVRVATSEA